MKFAVLIALLGASNAVRVHFTDDFFPSDDKAQMESKLKNLSQNDQEILAEMDHKIDQAKRNAVQGELGRTLAMNKINELKLSLGQLNTNFLAETEAATSDKLGDEDVPLISLESKKKSMKMLEQKVKQIKKRVPEISAIEVTLGLPEDIKDSELTQAENSMEKAIMGAKNQINTQSLAEKKAADEEKARFEPAQEEQVRTPVNE